MFVKEMHHLQRLAHSTMNLEKTDKVVQVARCGPGTLMNRATTGVLELIRPFVKPVDRATVLRSKSVLQLYCLDMRHRGL
jgi:hypothetical protein